MRLHMPFLCFGAAFLPQTLCERIYFHPATTDGLYYVLNEDPASMSTTQSWSDKPTVHLTSDEVEKYGTLDLECNGRYMAPGDYDQLAPLVCTGGDWAYIWTVGTAEAYFCEYSEDSYCDVSMWNWAQPVITAQCPNDTYGNVQGGWIRDYSTSLAAGRDHSDFSDC